MRLHTLLTTTATTHSLAFLKNLIYFLLLTALTTRFTHHLTSHITTKTLALTHTVIFLLSYTFLSLPLGGLIDLLVSSLLYISLVKTGGKYVTRHTPRFWADYLLNPAIVATGIWMLGTALQDSEDGKGSVVLAVLHMVGYTLGIAGQTVWTLTWVCFWAWLLSRDVPEYGRSLIVVVVLRVAGAIVIALEERGWKVGEIVERDWGVRKFTELKPKVIGWWGGVQKRWVDFRGKKE